MTQGGFFEEKRTSPTSMAIVIAIHAAAIGGLAMAKMEMPVMKIFKPIKIKDIPVPPPPPEVEQPRVEPKVEATPQPIIERPIIDLKLPDRTEIAMVEPLPFLPNVTPTTEPRVTVEPAIQPPAKRTPVRVNALLDPRYADRLQPPYPASEQRAGNEGRVTVRVTIGADGRVKRVEKVSAASDAFFRATERQALGQWRFKPATVDGDPIETTKVMTVVFRLDG